ncbi:MAG: 3-deoxy-7-phosphoheptulonate synthase [Chlamydiales bacterium]|jgi:3-deoxy-7-phosphoheptulonate synthase
MGLLDTLPMSIDNPLRIQSARTEIDRLDDELLQILARRMKAVHEVGRAKGRETGMRLLDTGRERGLLERWRRRAEATGLSEQLAGRVLREVLNHSRRAQEVDQGDRSWGFASVPRVAYQGEVHCYSDLAATKLFETRSRIGAERVGYRTFADAIDALRAARVDYALLPAENSIAGSIPELNQLLAERDLYVVDEEVWEVEHVLAVRPGTEKARITRVRSHPVALAQCGAFLSGLPGATPEPWHDTAGAAAALGTGTDDQPGHEGVAVIASEEAALAHGLTIVKRHIADQQHNVTRFLLLARAPEVAPRGLATKTSLLITLDHQRGALAAVLAAFAARSINLTRIESRPDPRTPWQYRFFIDLEGSGEDENLRRALEEVRCHCNLLRELGTYPMRTKEGEHLKGPERQSVPRPALLAPVEVPGDSVPAEAPDAPGRVESAVVKVGDTSIGGQQFALILGPCAVESREQILESAEMARRAGASILRGGAFKPRTSPHSFQGLGNEGLILLQEAGRSVELPVVTELMRIEDLEAVVQTADMIQVGARNMQNYALLRALGRVDRPILLKRGLSATVDELLSAAEYITAGGNQRVVLCERGIRTFETATRSTLDLGAVAVLKTRTHLPVIVDPSHAAGARHLVVPLALAAAAVGADGLIVEAHPNPAQALCDKDQALTAADLKTLVQGLQPILHSQGRVL